VRGIPRPGPGPTRPVWDAATKPLNLSRDRQEQRGIINEPVFLGRRWGVGYMWTEAAVYSAVSLVLGYVGWSSKAPARQQEPATSATEGQSKPPVGAGDQSELVTH
jgi:hypothetical protein